MPAIEHKESAGPLAAARRERGFTLVHALLLTALLSGLTASVAPSYAVRIQREREQALLEVGEAYRRALREYFLAAPGSLKRWPSELTELTRDSRFVGTRRHLRRAYTDPMRPGMPLALVRNPDGDIVGVRSLSAQRPLSDGRGLFAGAQTYSDWKFIATE